MHIKRKIIQIDEDLCNGCGLCAQACSEGAIQIIDGKARLVSERYCDGLGACIGECPQGALRIVERKAEEFDAEAVEAYLKNAEPAMPAMACGCPSTHVQEFRPEAACCAEEGSATRTCIASSLTNWPVQIRLIPAAAPFLKDARLLVAADCACVALANLHEDFLQGRVVMIGCPKFDDPEPYVQKFTEIFKANAIKGITALVMEVPCCQGLPVIVKKGMDMAGKTIPIEKVVINTRGQVIRRERI